MELTSIIPSSLQVGLRHEDVLEVLELGSLDCELLRDKGREMIEGTFTPSVALKHQQKDLKVESG
jgi:3-hydroxyisobutyrate dehydrogenase-like beta-hydroxyacid dehydrogenase